MNSKTIKLIIILGIAWFVLVIAGSFIGYLIYIKPHTKSTSAAKESAAQTQKAKTSQIAASYTEKTPDYNLIVMQKDMLKMERDSLSGIISRLNDSLSRISTFGGQFDSGKMKPGDKSSKGSPLEDSVVKLNAIIEKTNAELQLSKKIAESREKFIEQRYDTLEIKNFQTFAKIYDNSSSAEVARILERIDEPDAAMILKFMQKKKAGKVLDAMNPSRAAAIMLLGTGR